jgi:predicted aspartyl protease
MKFQFQREDEDGLLVVSITLDNKYELKMALDTGASHTTIDSNALYLSGYELKDSIGLVEIETANGIVETEVFEINEFNSLGYSRKNFQIQVYDFLAHGIFSNYNGLLGLDFLEGKDFCISLSKKTIEVK